MGARMLWGVGGALDSDEACFDRWQLAPASKTSRIAKPVERGPAMFIKSPREFLELGFDELNSARALQHFGYKGARVERREVFNFFAGADEAGRDF